MIISRNNEIMCTETCHLYVNNGFKYYYSGFVFIRGKIAGEDSVRELAKRYETSGLVPFSELLGAFYMFIKEPDGRIITFTDSNHLHALYVHEYAISDSFLPLISYLHNDVKAELSLSTEAIAERYTTGRTFFGKTLVKEISLSVTENYYVIKNNKISTMSKGISDIDSATRMFDMGEFFDSFVRATSKLKVSTALTGGYDSRMVYTFMKNRREVVPALSGNNEQDSDIIIGRKVARSAGQELFLVKPDKPALNDEYIEKMFVIHDGANSFCDAGCFRLREFRKQLGDSGVELHITGDGGVLHKDWEWMQDIPFYHKKNTNLKKFYNQRLVFDADKKNAGSVIQNEINDMEKNIIKQLQRYIMTINTQSYDMLYYHVNGVRDVLYSNSIGGVIMYAPLFERDMVSYSYALPRWQRFFYNNMRRLTTSEDATIARIPTCYGTTASNETKYIIRDILFQLVEYGKKFIRMMGRKILGVSLLVGNSLTWSIEDEIRKLDIVYEAIEFCKIREVIDAQASIEQLSFRHLECVLQVYLTARYTGEIN